MTPYFSFHTCKVQLLLLVFNFRTYATLTALSDKTLKDTNRDTNAVVH